MINASDIFRASSKRKFRSGFQILNNFFIAATLHSRFYAAEFIRFKPDEKQKITKNVRKVTFPGRL